MKNIINFCFYFLLFLPLSMLFICLRRKLKPQKQDSNSGFKQMKRLLYDAHNPLESACKDWVKSSRLLRKVEPWKESLILVLHSKQNGIQKQINKPQIFSMEQYIRLREKWNKITKKNLPMCFRTLIIYPELFKLCTVIIFSS